MNFNEKLQLAYHKIKKAKNILFVAHISPDADALSSLGVMISLAKKTDIRFYAYAEQKKEGDYSFIPNIDLISSKKPNDLSVFDLIISLDCGQLSRTNLREEIKNILEDYDRKSFYIEFDHHVPREHYADLEIRYPDKASTTEILYYFFRINNLEITKDVANCILTGIVADTGYFFHSNSSQQALLISSRMLLLGASLKNIIHHMVYNKNFLSLKIWGRVLDNMIFNKKTGLVISALTTKEMEELSLNNNTSIESDLFGEIVSSLNSLSGVKVALLLREQDGLVRGNLRTNLDNMDVSKIAQKFNGGGHKKAAGFTIPGYLKKIDYGWDVVK